MSDKIALDMIHDVQCARPNYIRPAVRNLRGASSLLQERCVQQPKPKGELKADGRAILSYLRLGMPPAGQIETRLRKMKGIKEARINHVSHTVNIRYDPSVLTAEKIRSVLKKLGSRKQR